MGTIDLRKHEQMFYDHSREDAPDQAQFFSHIHSDMEIYYLVEGKAEYHVENSTYILQPGDMVIMRPGEVHSSQADPSGPYERFNLRFSPMLLKETLNSRLLRPFLERPLGVYNHYSADELPTQYIRACFERIFANKQHDSQRRTMTYLLPILQEIYDIWRTRERPQEPLPTSPPARIIAYINEHLADLQSPRQLSEALYMSQSQIYRVFRAYTGTSVWDYVRSKRLFAARELMQNGTHPNTAAVQCGFTEYSTFYRAYVKHYGHPPKNDFTASGKP